MAERRPSQSMITNKTLSMKSSTIKDATAFKMWHSLLDRSLHADVCHLHVEHVTGLEYDETKAATNSKAPALATHLITTDNCIADL